MLRRVAELGPFFAVGTGTTADPGWQPVRLLYEDPEVLGGWVSRVGARLGTEETRVAASIGFQGYAARLWSVGLAALVLHARVPRLPPDDLLWSDEQGSLRLHVEHPGDRTGGQGEEDLWHEVVAEHLGPLVTAVRLACPLSERLLWGNAASALTGAARTIDGVASGPATAVADRLLARPPLRGTLEEPDHQGGRRRRSCCLFYRVPGGGLCGDCVLTHAPPTRAEP